MNKIVLCLSLLFISLSFDNLRAQDISFFENEKYHIDKIYPNPVQGQVFVELHSKNFTLIQFELIDILGNKVKQWKKKELVPGNQKISLDLQSFHSGFYLLKATVDGQVIVKRIRKM